MGWFDFLTRKKSDEPGSQRAPETVLPTSPLKSSLLSLEQRLMFDAAAAATAAEVAGEAVAQEQADAAVSGEGESANAESGSGEGHEVVEALTAFLPGQSPAEIVFVDPTVPDYATLLAGMDPSIDVIMLDGEQDGVTQMAEALSGRTGIDAIHIISHGEAGSLQLGTGTLNAESMSGQYAEQLATIQEALSEQADILVYGCDFAAGDHGQAAAGLLADLTGADVQASSDLTGHASLGGDWDLEVRTGAIEARIAIDVQEQSDWVGLLAAPQLDATKSPTLNPMLEDSGAPAGSVGTLVSSLVDFATPSGQVDNVTDADGGAALGIAITAANTTNGTWWFSTNNGATWNALGAVSDGSARLLAADAGTRIYFQANANFNGTVSDAIAFHAWDQTSGTNGGTANLATSFTARDQFDTVSYSNNNGTVNWGGAWQEIGEKDGTGSGMVMVNSYAGLKGNSLQIETDFLSGGASRQVDLSGTTSATLTFDYIRQHGGGTNGVVSVDVYDGKVWTTVEKFSINATDASAQTAKIDISGYANANTQIRFLVSESDAMGRLHVDNIEVTAGGIGGGASAYSHAADTAALTVTAVNDAPVDVTLSANTVAENAANGTVVGTVSGTDVDSGDTKTYSLTDNAGGRFAIHSGTGVITVADGSLLNHEAAASHNVTVRVTDAGGLSYDETFTVAVTNVNEAPVAVDDRAGLRFDGVDDFVEMGSGTVYEVTDTITMEAWINREPSSQASQIIINKEGEYEVGIDADGSLKWAFANTNPGWAWHDTGVVIPEHTWTHIAVTYDHGTITSYVDGVAVEVFAGSGTIGDAHPAKDTLRIGGRENNPANQYFAGQISEVQVWNTARTAGDIAADRSGTLSGTETGLLGYWKFNENSGTTADNLTANPDGTLGGASPGQSPEWTTYRVNEDNTLTVTGPGVLGNDADVDGDALTAVMVTGPSHANSFTLNPDGSFSYRPAADFSGTDSFTYRVSDGSTLSNIATVHIQVDPVNDAPVDLTLSANTVAENAANGTVVGTVSGTDPDTGDTKTYTLTDSAGGRFAIHSGTGAITVANGSLLNHEAATSHDVTVLVTDASGLTYNETFTITVSDVNEATPTITSNGGGATASIRINENIAAVTTVTATDGDTRQTLSYSISGGADASKFTIDNSTGALRFVTAPSFEAPTDSGANNVYDVTVRVSDNNGGSDTQAIAVTVNNVNEAPTDLALSASTVAENAANGTVVGTITGTDADAGDTKSYTFTNNAGGRFAINRTTGVITVANGTLLNYEAATSHDVTVRVTDRSGLTYDETFTIAVTNVNEAPAGTNATVTINEDTSHTLTVANFGFTDVDAGDSFSAVRITTLPTAGTLTLSGAAVTAGQVVSVADVAAGNLVFTPASNANGTGYARLTFSVRDSQNLYDATPNTLTMNVTAVNDAPTDLALSVSTVAENAANGTVVGTVTGSDPDSGDTKSYSFIDNAGGRFAINSSTGVITVANSTLLNYEAAPSHNVTVRVTDRGGLTYNETFTINLTNVNEAPTGIALSGNTVAENSPTGTVVGTASTTDPDAGDRHTYSLTNNAGGRFAIDGTTGQITVANGSLLNYDAASSHTITIRTTDAGGLARSQTFTINLSNVNEAPTDLSLSANRVAENAANGTVVGTVSGTDPDAGDTRSYSLTDNAGGRFAINSSTGVITVANGSLLDYEAASGHSVTVRITDAGGLTYNETFTITVTNVNEAPTDLALSANTVVENAANGTAVGTVSGTDPDSGDTRTYSLTNNAGGRFAINSGTGVITVANGTLLNYEAATSHNVTVRVTDRAGLTYNETFTIAVTNVNEAPAGTNATVTINEDTSHTLTVANFGFTDVDAGDSFSAVRITTLPTAGTLTLSGAAVTAGQVVSVADVAAGNLVFTPASNANGTGYARLTFSVRDSQNLYDATPNTLTVNVTAVNDAPTDLALSASTVAENAANGTVVGTVSGTDPDSGDTRTYSLTNNAGGRFAINSSTGVITVANSALLNYEAATSHNVTVRVTDRAGLTYNETFTIAVTNVNEAPAGTNATVTINEDTSHTLTVANFGFTDVDAGDSFSAVRITTLPTAGTLTLSGVAVTAGQVVSVADVAAGNLVFTPAANANGTGYARLTFSVRDSQNLYDATPNTLTVNVTAVNDAPVLSVNSGSTGAEGGRDTIAGSELAVTDVDHSAAQLTYAIGTGPAHGRLELTTAPGVSATSFTQADIAANRLVYVHDGSETVSDNFTFTVSDGAGGSLGATTVTLTITPVNDAPTIISNGGGATAAINVAEHVSAVTIVAATDADLPAQALSYSVSGGVDQALFTIDAATGALSFIVPPDFSARTDSNGDHVYTVQVRVTDQQGATVTQTLHVTVTDVAESRGPAGLPPSLVPITPRAAPLSPLAAGPFTPAATDGVISRAADQTPQEGPFRPDTVRSLAASPHRDVLEGRRQDEPPPTSPATSSDAISQPDAVGAGRAPEALSDLMFAKLDAIIEDLEKTVTGNTAGQVHMTRITAAAGAVLSVGFVAWTVRSTALAASLFAVIPVRPIPDSLTGLATPPGERKHPGGSHQEAAQGEQDNGRGWGEFFDQWQGPDPRPAES